MIGIKRCVNWLLDNKGKELTDGLRTVVFEDWVDEDNNHQLCTSIHFVNSGDIDYEIFEDEEWHPKEVL